MVRNEEKIEGVAFVSSIWNNSVDGDNDDDDDDDDDDDGKCDDAKEDEDCCPFNNDDGDTGFSGCIFFFLLIDWLIM